MSFQTSNKQQSTHLTLMSFITLAHFGLVLEVNVLITYQALHAELQSTLLNL